MISFMFTIVDGTNIPSRYPTYQLQLSRYIGDRAGLMAIAQLPLAWIFATRNDPLLWLTGWSFATYNRFHRWVARLCMVLAIVHSVSYSIYTWKAGPGLYAESWHDEYFYCGAIVSFLIDSLSLAVANLARLSSRCLS
jgi:predicted ferric reductase